MAFFGLVDVGEKRLTTRFILSEVIEKEILSEYAYDIFEPTLKLEIQGRDVLKNIGLDGIKRVVVMHFMESALRITKGMLDDLAKAATSEYTYWFLGTGFGLRVKREGMNLGLQLEVNPKMGPVDSSGLVLKSAMLGMITVSDWVHAIVSFSTELIELLLRVNPALKDILNSQESQRRVLEDWLKSGNP